MLEMFEQIAEDSRYGCVSDEVISERLNRLRNYIRLACGRAAHPEGSPFDWGPN
jgi:hypothetical protein